jgi:hypothetical protein
VKLIASARVAGVTLMLGLLLDMPDALFLVTRRG